MSRAAGPSLGIRRSPFKWIVSECSLTRLGPSKVLVNKATWTYLSRNALEMLAGAVVMRGFPNSYAVHLFGVHKGRLLALERRTSEFKASTLSATLLSPVHRCATHATPSCHD
jgi:hypothetical protein